MINLESEFGVNNIDFNHSIMSNTVKPNYVKWTTKSGTRINISRMDEKEIFQCIKDIHFKEIQFEFESISEGWLNAFSYELSRRKSVKIEE